MLAVGAPTPATAADSEVADGVLVRLPAATIKSVGPEAGAAIAAVEDAIEDLGFGWVLVEGDPNDPVVQAQVAALGGISAPNTIYELLEDPLFPDQWGLENTGQDGGTPGADIDSFAVRGEIERDLNEATVVLKADLATHADSRPPSNRLP